MNRKLFSVFFSALVCSTLGHEHLRARELQRHHARSHPLGFHHSRANQQQCSYICPVPSPSPEANASKALSLVFIKETNVFALVNVNLEVAIVFQIGEPIALLANGKTGVSVVINIDKETVVYYPAGSNDNLWKHPQSSLVEYLQKLGPLTNVNNWKNGKTSKLTSVTKDVKTIVISIIETLDVEIGLRAKLNPDVVISLISVSLNSLLDSKDILRLLLVKLDSSLTVVVGGLGKLVNLVAGLKVIGKKLNGGVQALIADNTSVSLLLGENSGLTSLLNLLVTVGVKVDLTKILGDLLKSPEAILALAVQLDGGIYYGVSGITAVIYNIQLFANKKISLEALIDILIQVQAVNGHVKITKEVWNNVVNWYFALAKSQVSQFKTESSWSALNKFFQDIKDEKLVINGINVSAIINLMISTSGNASLNNVVNILLQLKPLCDLNKIVATLYFRLVYFIISGQGLVFIQALLPDIKISIDLSVSTSTSIIKQILSNVNVLQILSYLLRLDIVGALTHLPILGPILKALDEILKAVGVAAQVTVTSALKAVGSILDDLKNIILFGLGKGGKAPSDKGIAGLSILGGGLTVSIKTSWTSLWEGKNTSAQGVTISSSSSEGSSTSGPSSPAVPTSSSSGASSPKGSSSGTTVSASSSTSSSSGASSPKGSSSGTTVSASSSTSSSSGASSPKGSSSGTTVPTSSSTGGSIGGSGSHSGGISIGGGGSSSGGSSSGGSGSHSGGVSIGGGGSSSGGSSSGGSGSHSGGISVGGGGSSSGGGAAGGSGSHSGGTSVGGGSSSSGGSSAGGSGSHSGGISIGGSGSSSGGTSWGGSGSHSGGISIGGEASSGGSGSGSKGGSGSHSGGISIGGSSSTGGGAKGSGSWSLGNLLGGRGDSGSGSSGSSNSHRWSFF